MLSTFAAGFLVTKSRNLLQATEPSTAGLISHPSTHMKLSRHVVLHTLRWLLQGSYKSRALTSLAAASQLNFKERSHLEARCYLPRAASQV